MGLFSSSSKSTTKQFTTQVSSTMGDLSHDNAVAANDITYNYTPMGISGDDLSNILSFAGGAYGDALKSITTSSQSAVQASGDAYRSASNETAGLLQDLKPIAVVAGIVVAVVAISKIWRK